MFDFKPKESLLIFAFACLTIILLAVFYPDFMFMNGFRYVPDTVHHEVPQAAFFIKTVQQGSFPLWNPYKMLGLPFFETTNIPIYHPAIIIYFLLPLEKAVHYTFLIHIFISALFMFLLCSEFKFSWPVSFFCSASWIFSSPFHYYLQGGYLRRTISLVFLPMLIYFFIKIANTHVSRKASFLIITSIVTALSITGGYPPMAAMVIYCAAIFILFSLKNLRDAKVFLVVIIFALLLSIIYWGPVFINPLKSILLPPSDRSALRHYTLSDLNNFFTPLSLTKGYIGKLGIALGFIGLFLKTPFSRNIRLLFLFSLLLIFTETGIPLTDFLPIANKTSKFDQWHFGLILSLIMSSGFCLNKFYLWLNKKSILKRLSSLIIGIVIILQLVDLYGYNQKFYQGDLRFGLFELKDYFPEHPFISFFRKDLSLFRVSNMVTDGRRYFGHLRKNQGTFDSVNIFHSFSRGVILDKISGEYNLKQDLFPGDKDMPRRVLNLCNIKYIVTDKLLSEEGYIDRMTWEGMLEPLYPPPPKGNKERFALSRTRFTVHVYENKQYFPRAFTLPNAKENEIEKVLLNQKIPALMYGDIPDNAMGLLSNYKNFNI